MKINPLLIPIVFFITSAVNAQPSISLQQIATGFTRPVDIVNAGDGRLFIVEQAGRIKIIDTNGVVLSNPFLDIRSKVDDTYNEQGLLSVAFHPDYKNNGYFYVYYTDNTVGILSQSRNTNISRFHVSSTDPNIADTAEQIILEIQQYSSNHNGGDMIFGPDGYLYIGMGDGGSGCDPGNRAQDLTNLLGKMLRIEVDSGAFYNIPASNPFYGLSSARNEIWAYGLRNPWRFSFDRLTGDLWIGDVGQDTREEIDFQQASSTGGENYGWKCYEANLYGTCGSLPSGCSSINQTPPVYSYANSSDCSVTGGFVYRGCENPALYGHYIFADYCSGKFWTIYRNGGSWATTSQGQFNLDPVAFGEDINGELYVADLGGKIYKINEASSGLSVSITGNDESCPSSNDGSADLTVNGGALPYSFQWSNGDTTEDISGLTANIYGITVTDDHSCVKIESVQIQSPVLNPDITASASTSFCQGDSVILSVQSGYSSYLWKINGSATAETSDNIIAEITAEYTVEVTDSNGCMEESAPVTVTVFPDPPTPVIIQNGSELTTSTNGASYQWYLNGHVINGSDFQTIIATQNGNYMVEITDSNGCTSVSGAYSFVATGIAGSTGVPIFAYPNPFIESFNIVYVLPESGKVTVKLFDVLGNEQAIVAKSQNSGQQFLSVDPGSLKSSGIYYLQLTFDDMVFGTKLIRN